MAKDTYDDSGVPGFYFSVVVGLCCADGVFASLFILSAWHLEGIEDAYTAGDLLELRGWEG